MASVPNLEPTGQNFCDIQNGVNIEENLSHTNIASLLNVLDLKLHMLQSFPSQPWHLEEIDPTSVSFENCFLRPSIAMR